MGNGQKLILIDGNAILHRAFHAIPPFKAPDGTLVNAVFGFASMLLSLVNSQKPDYIAVSFDLKGKTFRHEQYKDYKATRSKAPDELYAQIPLIKELVKTFRMPIYEIEGFEADDVLGTLAAQASADTDLTTYIVTGDMDALQLVGENVKVLAPVKGFNESKIYDLAAVLNKYGLNPWQIPDMKGLAGDNSDNIKGVSGIGPKTAKDLLQKYGSLENIYLNLEGIKEGVRVKLENDAESARFSKMLGTIVNNVPISLNLENCKTHFYDLSEIEAFFARLSFKSLIAKLASFHNHYSEKRVQELGLQQSLF